MHVPATIYSSELTTKGVQYGKVVLQVDMRGGGVRCGTGGGCGVCGVVVVVR